jgi:toxin YhaV
MLEIRGWKIGAYSLFIDQLITLIAAVEREQRKNPAGYRNGANAKLLAAVIKLTTEVIPERPGSPEFRQGDTLGQKHQHWFRAKFGGGRFRLFFRYSSTAKAILYAWINDQDSLRTYGRKTDAYNVFRKMLAAGSPPDDWKALLATAASPAAMERLTKALTKATSFGSSPP